MRLALLMTLAGALLAQPVTYHFGPTAGSRLALTVEKTGLWSGRKHVFEFERYHATAVIDRRSPGESSVEVTIDANSATCKDAWVSEKDRSKVLSYMRNEMLDTARHPRLTFRSERIVPRGDRAFEVQGVLTVRGIGKPVTVSLTVEERDGAVAAVVGQATVRIKDYGLTPPKAALGAIGTKNEMTVSFRLLPTGPTQ